MNSFISGCIYKSKKTGDMYLCHGYYLSIEKNDILQTVNITDIDREDYEEIHFS